MTLQAETGLEAIDDGLLYHRKHAMHDLSVLITFAGGLAVALVFGLIAHQLKLSPIVG